MARPAVVALLAGCVALAAGAARADDPPASAAVAPDAIAAAQAPPVPRVVLTDEELRFERRLTVTTAARRDQEVRRSSSATVVLTRDDILASGYASVADLLRQVAGVHVLRSAAGQVDVNIRGLNTPGHPAVLLLVDGRPAAVDFFGLVLWDQLPLALEDVERIEVIRGPASPLYGANAFSGVVQILSRRPGTPSGGTVTLGAGSREQQIATAVAGGRTGPLGVTVAVGHDSANDFSNRVDEAFLRAQDPLVLDRRGTAPGHERTFGTLSCEWAPPGPASATLRLGWTRVGLTSVLTSDTTWLSEDADSGFAHFVATVRGEGLGEVRISAWARHDRYPVETRFATAGGPVYTLREVIENDLVELEVLRVSRPFEGNVLTYGLSWRASGLQGRAIFGRHERSTMGGLFLQDEYRLADTLDVTLGLRADLHSESGASVSPRGSVVWTPHPRHALRASAGQAYRNPTNVQNFVSLQIPTNLPSPAPATVALTGDPDLKPERQTTLQADWETTLIPETVLESSLFYEHVEDLIVFFPPPTAAPVNYQNVGTVDLWGGEATVHVRVAPGWHATGGYAFLWVHGAFEGVSPRHQGHVGLRATWSGGLSAAAMLHATGKSHYHGQALVPDRRIPAYATVEARLAYAFGRGTLALSVTDLLGGHHQEFPRGDEVAARVLLTLQWAI